MGAARSGCAVGVDRDGRRERRLAAERGRAKRARPAHAHSTSGSLPPSPPPLRPRARRPRLPPPRPRRRCSRRFRRRGRLRRRRPGWAHRPHRRISPSLGRYIVLRDVYGDLFTYAGLGGLAHDYVPPKTARAVLSRRPGGEHQGSRALAGGERRRPDAHDAERQDSQGEGQSDRRIGPGGAPERLRRSPACRHGPCPAVRPPGQRRRPRGSRGRNGRPRRRRPQGPSSASRSASAPLCPPARCSAR